MNDKSINTTIQIIDRAIPAERKSRPKIALNMALAGVMSLFIGVFIAFFQEYLSKQKKG
jgi:tyrosine-protein kinase Etk/Wzc